MASGNSSSSLGAGFPTSHHCSFPCSWSAFVWPPSPWHFVQHIPPPLRSIPFLQRKRGSADGEQQQHVGSSDGGAVGSSNMPQINPHQALQQVCIYLCWVGNRLSGGWCWCVGGGVQSPKKQRWAGTGLRVVTVRHIHFRVRVSTPSILTVRHLMAAIWISARSTTYSSTSSSSHFCCCCFRCRRCCYADTAASAAGHCCCSSGSNGYHAGSTGITSRW